LHIVVLSRLSVTAQPVFGHASIAVGFTEAWMEPDRLGVVCDGALGIFIQNRMFPLLL